MYVSNVIIHNKIVSEHQAIKNISDFYMLLYIHCKSNQINVWLNILILCTLTPASIPVVETLKSR